MTVKTNSPKRNQIFENEKDDFAMEIEQKLKLVLDNVHQG